MVTEERWVGVKEVATHLGVAKDSVYRWIDNRGLPSYRVGRLFSFKLSEIDEWVRQDSQQEADSNSARKRKSSKAVKNSLRSKTRTKKKAKDE